MSGVWRKGVCDRCQVATYVHVAVGRCGDCMRADQQEAGARGSATRKDAEPEGGSPSLTGAPAPPSVSGELEPHQKRIAELLDAKTVRYGGNRSGKPHMTLHLQLDEYEKRFGWRPPCPLCPPIAVDLAGPLGDGPEEEGP